MNWLRLPLVLLLLQMLHAPGTAQLGAWSHRIPVVAVEEAGTNRANYPILFFVDTQSLISNQLLEADGRDLRFSDSCGVLPFPYFIESDLNTDSTRIWVRIPGVNALDSLHFFLYHGNPTANPGSDLSTTFPNALVSQGNVTLSGTNNFDWFELESADTLFLGGNAKVTVEARNIILDGVVMGNGRGAAQPILGQSGNGMGAGTTSVNAGAGGGAYGGKGGNGGYDFADTPGAGGMAYGTKDGLDLDVGSSGGSSPVRLGGAGGGALDLRAESIRLQGPLMCNGEAGQQPGTNQGGGGGAGGGVQMVGKFLDLSGSIEVDGGGGSQGFSASNDDGGGGGGGRVKLRYGQWLKNSAIVTADGGPGGSNGSQEPGQPGEAGSIMDTLMPFPTVKPSIGISQLNPLPQDPILLADPPVICEDEPVNFMLPTGYTQYDFFRNLVLQQSGPDSIWMTTSLNTGDVIVSHATLGTCVLKDTFFAAVAPTPQVAIVASDSSPCQGDTVILDVGPGWQQVVWNTGDSTAQLAVGFSGFYDVEIQDINQCTARDTYVVNLGAVPFPSITVNGLPACEGEVVTLSTGNFPTYLWANGGQTSSIPVANSGTYAVTVTATNGCTNSASINLELDSLPTPDIFRSGNTLSTQVGYLSYQWLYNNSPLVGETTPVHVAAFNGNYSVEVEGLNGCKGKSAVELVIVGNDEEIGGKWTLFPQPAQQGWVQVEGHLEFPDQLKWRVLDGMGREIRTWSTSAEAGPIQESISLQGLHSGMYWVEVRSLAFSRTLPIIVP